MRIWSRIIMTGIRIMFLDVTVMYDGSNGHRMNQTQKNTLHRAIIEAFARFEWKWTLVN